jgi:hypothetical protein
MKTLLMILAIAFCSVAQASEDRFVRKSSPLLPPVVAMSDLIAAGVLKIDVGETDTDGNTEVRFYLEVPKLLKGVVANHTDPFSGKISSESSLALNVRVRGFLENRSLYSALSNQRVIVFLRKSGVILENIDPWFYIQPYSHALEQEVIEIHGK